MRKQIDFNKKEDKRSAANVTNHQKSSEASPAFDDKRSETLAQRKMQELMNNSPIMQRAKGLNTLANQGGKSKAPLQLLIKDKVPKKNKYYTKGKEKRAYIVERQAVKPKDGGVPSTMPKGWEVVLSKLGRAKGKWVRFHLINQWLGGPGHDPLNLVPTTNAINQDPQWRALEESAKGLLFNGIPIYMKVRVSYPGTEYGPKGFPESIHARLEYFDDGNGWKEEGNVTISISPPSFDGNGGSAEMYPHELSGAGWNKGVGIRDEGICKWLASKRGKLKTVSSVDQIIDMLTRESQENHPTWNTDINNGPLARAERTLISAARGLRKKFITLIFP